MSDLKNIIKEILIFRDEREWGQFHTPKDLAICLNVEASELLELFLWKKELDEKDMPKLERELADVFYSAFLLADYFVLDVKDIILRKLKENEEKYPVAKAKGSNKKYDELG